jgi:hypothetical protein
MVLIFSFDPAVINLGFCALLIDRTGFRMIKIETWDISTQGMKWDKIPNTLLAKELKAKLRILDEWQLKNYPNEKLIVLSEYIFKPGSPAIRVGDMIVYHYEGIQDTKVYGKVPPALKNKLWFDESLKYEVFAQKYSTAYLANKKHAEANFLWYCKQNPDRMPTDENIVWGKKKDDIADAFMQALAMIRFGNINLTFDNTPNTVISEEYQVQVE